MTSLVSMLFCVDDLKIDMLFVVFFSCFLIVIIIYALDFFCRIWKKMVEVWFHPGTMDITFLELVLSRSKGAVTWM